MNGKGRKSPLHYGWKFRSVSMRKNRGWNICVDMCIQENPSPPPKKNLDPGIVELAVLSPSLQSPNHLIHHHGVSLANILGRCTQSSRHVDSVEDAPHATQSFVLNPQHRHHHSPAGLLPQHSCPMCSLGESPNSLLSALIVPH